MIIPESNRLEHVKEYYFSKKLDEIRGMLSKGIPVINLGIGNPDLMPSQNTISKLIESAQNPKNHGYQSYRSIIELRQAISNWYNKIYKVKLEPNTEVLPLIGSKEGITHISMTFLNQGDEVLIPNPSYPTYTSVSNLAGAKIRFFDLDEKNNWAVDIDKLKKQDLSKVKIMWINYPNMPTGATGNIKLFEKLIKLANDNKFLICNDNPYSMILNNSPQSILSIDGAMDVAVELNSLSKSHNMAGWRIGWLSGKKTYIDSVLKFKSNVDSGMFLPLQHAAIEAMNNNIEWHNTQNKIYEKRRKIVWELFDILNCSYSKKQVGMFVWAKLPENIDNSEMFVDQILHSANVFITPGFIFGTNGDRYIRVSLCSDISIFEEAIERIKKIAL